MFTNKKATLLIGLALLFSLSLSAKPRTKMRPYTGHRIPRGSTAQTPSRHRVHHAATPQ